MSLTPQADALAFDLDDTLCDSSTAKTKAIAYLASTLSGSTWTQDNFIAAYRLNEPHLYKAVLNKELSIPEYQLERFRTALCLVDIPFPEARVEHLNTAYMRRCNEGVKLFPEALEALQALHTAGIPLALITNGTSDGQRAKIKALRIEQYFQAILISAEARIAKPDARIYQSAALALGVTISNLLMVGDSVNEDYKGALKAGAQALLVDRSGRHVPAGVKRVRSLSELTRTLNPV